MEQKSERTAFARQRMLAVFAALAMLLGSLWFARTMAPRRESVALLYQASCLVIDPGHGGLDGGAIAYNGVKESDLNLEIGLKLRDLAAFCGVETQMTRQDDLPRTAAQDYSEHEDLVYRANFAGQIPNAVLISIHQNTFPTSQPSGAQVLYGPDAESRKLGELTHRNLIDGLQPQNRRVAEPAPKSLYLTAHVQCPVILVECGFLSNLSDLQLLSDPNYQRSLAAVLLASYLQYTAGMLLSS